MRPLRQLEVVAGTPSWYQVETRSYAGKRVWPMVGSQVRPGREKSSEGLV